MEAKQFSPEQVSKDRAFVESRLIPDIIIKMELSQRGQVKTSEKEVTKFVRFYLDKLALRGVTASHLVENDISGYEKLEQVSNSLVDAMQQQLLEKKATSGK